MACCLIVMYLAGRAYDQLLRWAIYWGLRPVPARWTGGFARDHFRRRPPLARTRSA